MPWSDDLRAERRAPRFRVAIAGATGAVGQKFITLLAHHPWFEITALAASERSAGKRYGDAVRWLESHPCPERVAALPVTPVSAELDCDFVFSGLDTAAARELEPMLAAAGLPVISNASAFRQDPRVPLLVPEVNPEHTELLRAQGDGPGYIVTNPNCSVVGLVMALKPLADAFGLTQVAVTTMQAVSGAGYPGVPTLDILGNVIPLIRGEEEKIEAEPRKILGDFATDTIRPYPVVISAQANRVPVLDGHTLSVAVRFERRASLVEVKEAFAAFRDPLLRYRLPSAPKAPLVLAHGDDGPQPRVDAHQGGGMTVTVGRLKECSIFDVRFVALVHNTIRGAAGGAILNAELLVRQGHLTARQGAREVREVVPAASA